MSPFLKKSLVFSALLFITAFPQKANALAKFSTDYQNYYQVRSNGSTHVSFVISQKNNLSVVYATDFGININETKIENVKVTDEGITVIPDIVKTLNQTTISFPFANKIVGKNKVHSFTIEYDTTDIATKYGTTWQINIPRLETDENVSSRAVVLSVPPDFPSPAYMDPKPDSVSKNIYYFSDSKLGNKTISAVFGQTQFYKADIKYHLVNDSKIKTYSEIAIPPDTAYQTVYLEKIEPQPDSIYSDQDGNFLAKYTLNPGTTLDISLTEYIKLEFLPKPSPNAVTDSYLSANLTWNYDNGAFSMPELKNLLTAKSIYDYVVDKLQYDYEKVNRQKSQKTPAAESLLNYQSAICTDFSNVFVSLARKVGIPSREIEGYALSENSDLKPLSLTQDVLHAWVDYYNFSNNTWTQIDPTWANTTRGIDYFYKLDFNHIAFVIHGTDPNYPIPAGGYKYKQEKTKDISIIPVDSQIFPKSVFELVNVKQNIRSLNITLKNKSGVSFAGNANLETNNWIQGSEKYLLVPPYGESIISVSLRKTPILSRVDTKVIIYLNGHRQEFKTTIQPIISSGIIFTLAVIFLGLITIVARSIHIRRRKQKTSLYR